MSTGIDTASLHELAARGSRELRDATAEDILRWTIEHFGTDWCITSSMTDAVLPQLAAKVAPGVDVIFLDTGYHFAETIGTRDAVAALLPVTVRTVLPLRTVAEQDAEFGPRLYERDPNACCAMRKVEPLERALVGYRAWATGVRRADSADRQDAQPVEWDAKRGMVKVNPIVAWTDEQVDRYIADNGVLTNPLLTDGYGSIGCAPCTRRLLPGEDLRAGRWSGTGKTECGLHV
jgi:phosphoadenosine phosphosulfate reductase